MEAFGAGTQTLENKVSASLRDCQLKRGRQKQQEQVPGKNDLVSVLEC